MRKCIMKLKTTVAVRICTHQEDHTAMTRPNLEPHFSNLSAKV